MTKTSTLPINAVLPDIRAALHQHHDLILQAPPGAGKTTMVPLALLTEPWLEGKILMLEPRRMAARAAAERMAQILGETPGQTVGFRIRQETQVGPKTRIEVITGGVLLRMLLNDPSLADYSLVIFDEFHERSLDADSGFALALQGRALLRDQSDPLKLLLMSATLDDIGLSQLLPNAQMIQSQGRQYPVKVEHLGQGKRTDLVHDVTQAIHTALKRHKGSILVFLPGQGDILKVAAELKLHLPDNILLAPLYGALPLAEQLLAIAALKPDDPFARKVVLATDIAETSLTIDGVEVVIDSGYCRQPIFDTRTGLTRLQTVRISQASAQQRAGRAGRLCPGHCYRLWPEPTVLAAHTPAEILQADLAPLALLLLGWGVHEPLELEWLTPPKAASWQQAIHILQGLGAIKETANGAQLTAHGEAMLNFPAHPRLAHMMIAGARAGLATPSAVIAAILTDPPRSKAYGDDLEDILNTLLHGRAASPWHRRISKQAHQFERLLKQHQRAPTDQIGNPCGFLLALAYPDRIAKRRNGDGIEYQLSNGRAAKLNPSSHLTGIDWLAVAESGGASGLAVDVIYLAAPLDPMYFDNELADHVQTRRTAAWDEKSSRFIAQEQSFVGAIPLRQQPLTNLSSHEKQSAITEFIRQKGLDVLSWDEGTLQWCARVNLLRELPNPDPSLPAWPDTSEEGLTSSISTWLKPHLGQVNTLADLKKLDLKHLLAALLPWPLPQKLDQWAPTHITVPSRSHIAIDYRQTPPVLAVKLQEMFGCENTPTIAQGRIKLLVHLLSPGRRPVQVTQDLAGFWRNSYDEVKKELKGRYPKHPWPDDPLQAQPTRHTNKYLARNHQGQ